MTTNQRNERSTTEKVRDLVLLSLPLAYTLGFLSWSIYAHRAGAGFLPLTVPNYLVAGYVVSVLVAVLIGPWLVLFTHVKSPLQHITASLLSSLLLLLLIDSIGTWLGLIDLTWPITLVLLALTGLGLGWAHAVPTVNRWRGKRVSPSRTDSVTQAAIVLLASLFIFGHVILPTVPPAFGGAESDTAIFDLDPSRLTPALRDWVIDWNFSSMNDTSLRTLELNVLLETSDYFLVRTEARSTNADALYQIPRDSVWTVTWT